MRLGPELLQHLVNKERARAVPARRPPPEEEELLKQALLGADVEAPPAQKKRPWCSISPAAAHKRALALVCVCLPCPPCLHAATGKSTYCTHCDTMAPPACSFHNHVLIRQSCTACRYQLIFTAVMYVWPTTPWLQLRAGVCVLAVACVRLLNLAVPILYRCVLTLALCVS